MRPIISCFILILIILVSCSQETDGVIEVKQKQILFDQISASHSNIQFVNTIKDDGHHNPFTYNFLYQGAGVGVGDFDNDGLIDIYFAGNMETDKIYRNLGDWKFEDRTQSSGIQDNAWSTGVSVVDINADGLLDVYVCKHSYNPFKLSKKNKLFINQGNFRFVEAADAYGLGDQGFSIQALFVDIDNDNDLDCYLVNQKIDNYTKILFPTYNSPLSEQQDKLYINQNGKFIKSSMLGNSRDLSFGLNPVCGDFDNNGFIDIHVSTDYDMPDALFMNYNGKLVDEASSKLNHTSHFSMGSDVADFNNDGMLDLFCVDMSYNSHYRSKVNMAAMNTEKYNNIVKESGQYQNMINTLQVNDGHGGFQEIGQLANVQSTDWSWAPLFVDFDQDGRKDIVVSNGIPKDIKNKDNENYAQNELGGNITVNNFNEIYQRLTSHPVSNVVYNNKGNYKFDNVSAQAGMDEKGFSTGMAYADFDNDGDLDLVINNTNAHAGLYKNVSKSGHFIIAKVKGPKGNFKGLGKTVTLYTSTHKESYTIQAVRGYMSSSQEIAHFGISEEVTIDSIDIVWDSEYRTVAHSPQHNTIVSLAYSDKEKINGIVKSNTLFSQIEIELPTHKENFFDDYKNQILLPHSLSQNGPTFAVGDINSDQLEDIYFGSSIDQKSKLLLQNTNGTFDSQSIDGSAEKEDSDVSYIQNKESPFFLVSHGSGQDGNADKVLGLTKVAFTQGKVLKTEALSYSQADLFKTLMYDDLLWLFERTDVSKYPNKCKAKLFQLDSKKNWKLIQSLDLGMITDAVNCDIDDDGDVDIIALGEWMDVIILENKEAKYIPKPIQLNGKSSTGWWNSIALGDFNDDGLMDFVAGNLGLNNKFKPSESNPFYIFSDDFDKDGSNDIILAKTEDNKLIPVRGKDCSSQEVSFINQKFKNYESFAIASLDEIYGTENLNKSSSDTIYSFTSKVFLQQELGFRAIDLPTEAQFGPIKDMLVEDINLDGNLDIIFAGNQYGVEVETVRYDAGRGGILLGDGKGEFKFMNALESGLHLNGDFRELDTIHISGKKHLIASQNSGKLLMFKLNN